jgi:hypothetical protein
MSNIITHASETGEPAKEVTAAWPDTLMQNDDLVLFESLVREYCGVGFFECLGSPASGHLTSALWEESETRPPALFRTVVELLHRAVERESEV